MGAGADLHPDAVARAEPVRRGPQLHLDSAHSLLVDREPPRHHPGQPVTDVAGAAVGRGVAEAGEDVEVRAARAYPDVGPYRTSELELGGEGVAAVDQHIAPGFEGRVVARSGQV